MREIRTSGLMSGDGKPGDADTAHASAPVLDSTRMPRAMFCAAIRKRFQCITQPGVKALAAIRKHPVFFAAEKSSAN
jgi:hypothetical protein